jgi:bifunctional DNase/RNase
MHITTAAGFTEMRIARVVGFGPPLAPEDFRCVVLDEVSGDRHLVIEIGAGEAFDLAANLQGRQFGRPMTYQFAAALVHGLGGQVRQVKIDRLVDGAVAATVETDGPLGVRRVDARASDALNLAVVTAAPVFVSAEVAADGEQRRAGDSAVARLLRQALTAPPVTVASQQD